MTDRAKTIVLVGCARAKQSAPAPAEDLYVSDLFRKSRAYARSIGDRWFILSAEHGLIEPRQVIEPYDRTLTTMDAGARADWSRRVLSELEGEVGSGDRLVILAGRRYYEHLVPALQSRGIRVDLPLEGKRIGQRLAWLAGHGARDSSEPPQHDAFGRFARCIGDLGRQQGFPSLEEALSQGQVPEGGVYFFVDPSEPSVVGSLPGRIVRVGTHALREGARSTLATRLRQHSRTLGGGGHHRGSVFRRHVGFAMMAAGAARVPSWGTSLPDERAEAPLEAAVSRYLRALLVVVLGVDGGPEPWLRRAFVERNAIGVLSSMVPVAEAPSVSWLGHHARVEGIRRRGLWNVNHLDHAVDGTFIDQFEDVVEHHQSQSRSPAAPRSARGSTVNRVPRAGEARQHVAPASAVDVSTARFASVLDGLLRDAASKGEPWRDVSAAELHTRVGGYPGARHRMPTCCAVMRSAMKEGDVIRQAPPEGVGASLIVRYRLDGARAVDEGGGAGYVNDQAERAEAEFEGKMRTLPARAEAACPGYRPTMFAREVQRHGGLRTARKFLATGPSVQSGLQRLAGCGALHVSMECLVLRYWQLFDEEERSVALQRLHAVAAEHPHRYPDLGAICRPR